MRITADAAVPSSILRVLWTVGPCRQKSATTAYLLTRANNEPRVKHWPSFACALLMGCRHKAKEREGVKEPQRCLMVR